MCKWHLFIFNLAEDVFDTLKTIFQMDYKRSLKFKLLPEEPTPTCEQCSERAPSVVDQVLKGTLLGCPKNSRNTLLYVHSAVFFLLLQGALLRPAWKLKLTLFVFLT